MKRQDGRIRASDKRIEDIIKNGKKAKGRSELLKYYKGERLQSKQAILAKCFECSCGYADGLLDCALSGCPLYPLMPYRRRDVSKTYPVFAPVEVHRQLRKRNKTSHAERVIH
jgi:hypothetical protein